MKNEFEMSFHIPTDTSARPNKLPHKKIAASMIQRQFWLINQLQPQNSAYNIPAVFILKGLLDRSAIEQGVNEIIRRHEIFRTSFTTNEGRLMQEVVHELNISLPTTDISNIAVSEQEKELKRIIDKEIVRPFDLEKAPLIRVQLVQQSQKNNVLLINMHHIITDLHSKGLFASELSSVYKALTRGSPLPSSSSTLQYGDYSAWQQEWLSSPQAKRMGRFWQKELAGYSCVLNLPTDYPRPARLSYNGASRPFLLSREHSDALKEFSRKRSVDIFVTLLAAYLVLLARYSNQKDIIIGVPLSNRRREEDKNIMGCFVNILPLAFDLTDSPTFNEVLRQVRWKMLTAHRNQEASFETIVNLVQPEWDPSYNPLFQAGFTVEPPMKLELNNLQVKSRKIHNQGAQLDILVNIWRLDKEIHGYVEYNKDLFTETTVTRFASHYKVLLKSILKEADQAIDTLQILTKPEQHTLLTKWNDTTTTFSKECCLQNLFENQVTKCPDSIAAVFEETQLTYSELNGKANQLANYLRSIGVEKETLVGVYMDRSMDMLISIYGVLKAGGAYVPLDPIFPRHRIEYMLEDTGAEVILSQEIIAKDLPPNRARLLFLDKDWPLIAEYSSDNLVNASTPESLAYIIFTSGSTGRPKGVQVPHKAVVNFLLSMEKEPGISAGDTLLAVTTLSFDISVLELFLPLIAGAKIVIAGRDTVVNGQKLLQLLRSSQSTIMQATPTTWHLLLSAGLDNAIPLKVLCGGEALPQDLAQKLTDLSTSVWNLYGPTETTIWSTCYRVTPGKPICVGRPIANTHIYIVNEENQPTPVGVAGELLIGGTGVTHGYLNRPELTKKQFIPDHYTNIPNGYLYRTGDLASYMSNGNIRVLGRLDHQVKIRGYRIEPGEIETALETHFAVKQAAVIPHEYSSGNVRLVAYVTQDKGQDINVPELKHFLSGFFPDYMLPAIFTKIKEMPLTLNNKINRRALPPPAQSRPELNIEFVPPRNETEKALERLWKNLLGLERIGIDDSFFDIGGNSLLSVQLVEQVKQELSIEVPIMKFYQYPTIRSCSDYLKQSCTPTPVRDTAKMTRAQLQRQALSRKKRFAGR